MDRTHRRGGFHQARRWASQILAAGLIAGLLAPGRALGAPGDLDPDFGSGGLVIIPGGTFLFREGRAVAIQKDGRIVVAVHHTTDAGADFSVWRFRRDGSPDASFDGDGAALLELPGEQQPRALALQKDGKIVVAGFALVAGRNRMMVARFGRDGSLDTSFAGGQGFATLGLADRNVLAGAVALQKDGAIVAAGWTSGAGGEEFAVARFLRSGSPDPTFDDDGLALTDFQQGGNEDQAHGVAIQKDGRIVVAGYSNDGSGIPDFALARYLKDGTLDSSFDDDGRVTTDQFGVAQVANALAILKDGRILVAGAAEDPGGIVFGLARYLKDGSLDSTFGAGGLGVQTTSFGVGQLATANGVALQKRGKFVTAGFAEDGANRSIALARHQTDGRLDLRFQGAGGLPGRGLTNLDGFAVAHGVALQKDGKIVVVGFSGLTERALVVARYLSR
jgi:uncharacterized delta-60 repeat protein